MARTRPNIVLVTFHDLGIYLGCYGTPGARTPVIDRFAHEGVVFTNHFATATFCSPSRGAIITGKWPHCNGLMGLVNLGWNLPPENKTIDGLLRQAGYETVLFGLQHEVRDVRQLGFERVAATASRRCRDVVPAVVSFLRERARTRDRPFYARVGFNEAHRRMGDWEEPWIKRPDGSAPPAAPALPYLADTEGARQDFTEFSEYVACADAELADLFAAVDDHAIREDTIVVVTTDHGIDFPRAKGTLYDSGLNTALILRWPREFRGGHTQSELLSNIDLLPTMLEAAGIEAPADVCGRSFLPLLRNEAWRKHEAIFAERNTTPDDVKRCVRTERYKYIRNFNEGPMLALGTCTEYSLTRWDMGDDHLAPRPAVELYDLAVDPLERENRAGAPLYAAVEAELAQTLSIWMERTNDPLLKGPIPRPPEEADLLRSAWESMRRWGAEHGRQGPTGGRPTR